MDELDNNDDDKKIKTVKISHWRGGFIGDKYYRSGLYRLDNDGNIDKRLFSTSTEPMLVQAAPSNVTGLMGQSDHYKVAIPAHMKSKFYIK